MASQSTPAPQAETLASRGSYHFSKQVAVKNEAKVTAPTQFTFEKGDKVNYDKSLLADGHQWLSYVSYSGTRRYVDLGQVASSSATAPTTNLPASGPIENKNEQKTVLSQSGSYTVMKTVPVKTRQKIKLQLNLSLQTVKKSTTTKLLRQMATVGCPILLTVVLVAMFEQKHCVLHTLSNI